jgi:hypothetical protein
MQTTELTKNQLLQIEQASVNISGSSDEWPILKGAIEIITGKPLENKSAKWLKDFCKNYLRNQNEEQTEGKTEEHNEGKTEEQTNRIISPITSESSDCHALPVSGEASF